MDTDDTDETKNPTDIDDTADNVPNRWLDHLDNARVALTTKDSFGMYTGSGGDAAEVYSQPRIAQAAAEFS